MAEKEERIPEVLSNTIAQELLAAGDRTQVGNGTQARKKNYAEALSRQLAQRVANALRPKFEGVLPDEHGRRHESRARTSKGIKKLDVNYSTPELGLGLGVSIKTINFRDKATGRYTKNYTRADAELRAEASDYHERQPWAVMVAIVFIPTDACDDGSASAPSSFGRAVQIFRFRSKREKPQDPTMLFERVFIGLYDTRDASFGRVGFFDVVGKPPRIGAPKSLLSFSDLIDEILKIYELRNFPMFEWDDADPETMISTPIDTEDSDEAG